MKIKNLIFFVFFLFAQNVNATWVLFYESQMLDAKLLIGSVQQVNQKTQALVAISFKDNLFPKRVGSHVILLEHICGEINPKIIEEKFYDGLITKANEITIDVDPVKLKIYSKKVFPNLIKQICI